MNIYQATIDDVQDLIKLRLDYLNTEQPLSETNVAVLTKQLNDYFTRHLLSGDFIAIIAKIEDNIASAAFLVVNEYPANLSFITGKTGTLLNVLTYPQYRRKGIAIKVIGAIIRKAKQMGVSSIDLYATADGKELYEKLGFQTPEYSAMRLKLQNIK